MALKGYTTTVPASKSVDEITDMLRAHGARSITTDFERTVPVAVEFSLDTPHGLAWFRLPARVDRVLAVLMTQYRAKQLRSQSGIPTRAQAERVAWRIIRDWVAAQLALIDTDLVDATEILLPYMLTDQAGTTVYDRMLATKFLAPPREGQQR